MRNKYDIKYLPSFDEEFNDILHYIKHKLKNKKAANVLIESVNTAILNRSINPECFEVYKSIKSRKYKWYRIYVGNYTIFYTVTNNIIKISHIFYNKRDIENLISKKL